MEHASKGTIFLLVFSMSVLMYYLYSFRSKSSGIYIRKIPGIDAINEAVGRAAELGRPVSFSTALTSIGPVFYACLGVLYYVARKAASFKQKLFVPQTTPEAMALVEDTVRDAYRDQGRLALFDPQTTVFLSEEQFAFASGYMGLIHREKVASAFLFGQFSGEALILSEAGDQIGAMQVAACVSPEQVSFFVCTCDYTLIGEELFASSAYLSRDNIQIGSLYGQDRIKLLFLLIIAVGILIATWNSIYPDSKLTNVDYWLTN